MGATAAIASLVIGAGSAYMASEERKEAAAEQKKAQKKQSAIEQNRLTQSRRQQVREERLRRAQILQRAEGMGLTGSSGAMGSVGALGTQTAFNIGAQTGEGIAATSVSRNLQNAADAQASASDFAALSGLSMQVFSASGGFDNIFKGSKGST